jgi:hypothetical protein
LNHRGHADRGPKLPLGDRYGRERIRPLLFFQIGDRGRIVVAALVSIGIRRRLILEHRHHAEVMAVLEPRRVDDQRPPVAPRRWDLALDTKRTGPQGLGPGQ